MPRRPKDFDIETYLLQNSQLTASGCRVWLRSCDECGYGRLKYNGQQVTHRIAFAVWHDLPEDQWDVLLSAVVMHSCDNPPCIAKDHLVRGTYKANNDDARKKGRVTYRGVKGEKNTTAKLVDADIPVIRKLRRNGRTLHELAAMYGVSHTAISLLCRGKTWCHIRDSNPCSPAENREA